MTKRRPAPADHPSSMKSPDYRKLLKEKQEAEDKEWASRSGPVETRKITGTRVGEWGGD